MAQGHSVLTQNMKYEDAILRNLQSHFRQEAAGCCIADQHQSVQSLNGGLQVTTLARQCTEKPKRAGANGENNTGKKIFLLFFS